MRTRALLLTTAAALLATASAATASIPQPPDCPLVDRSAKAEHAIPGTELIALDPYGGLYSRTQGFAFSVTGPPAAVSGVARVEWAVDGTTRRVDDRGPTFRWQNYPGDILTPGSHVVRVTAVPQTGTPASVEFKLDVTGCPYAQFVAFPAPAPGKGATELMWDSAAETDEGAALTAVSARAVTNIVSALPKSVRGRTVGTLTLTRSGASTVTRTLRAPRTGGVLLRSGGLRVTLDPGAAEFLRVTGLPARTTAVKVDLKGAGTRLVHAKDGCRMALLEGTLRSGSVSADETSGGRLACAPRS